MRISRIVALLAVLLILLGIGASSIHTQRAEKEAMAEGQAAQEVLVGGIQDAPGKENDLHVLDLARFAVDEHNKKANALLEFEKLVKVKEQVVAGTMYYFTIAAKDGGVTKLYEAKVWEKVWMNFKQLEEFKPAGGAASA